jgi:hypothetical protein
LIQECYEFYTNVTQEGFQAEDIRTLFRKGFHHEIRQLISKSSKDGIDNELQDVESLNRILVETKLGIVVSN